MANKNVTLHWDAQELFTVKDRDEHQIPINNGRGIGASDLLVMSLIGCSAYDVVEILNKQRQELGELKVSAETVQDDTPPWKFKKIHIHYQAIGKGLDPEKVKKAIHLSEEKYCSVYATLKDVVEITHDVEVTTA
ncbi:MAG: OsmC family protein [Anaerolineales bacterium]|nr:OsmC family protein [Anaerolineales bacterium]